MVRKSYRLTAQRRRLPSVCLNGSDTRIASQQLLRDLKVGFIGNSNLNKRSILQEGHFERQDSRFEREQDICSFVTQIEREQGIFYFMIRVYQ